MPFFTEGQDSLDAPGVNPAAGHWPLLTQQQVEQNHREFVQKQYDQQMLEFEVLGALVFAAVCALGWLYHSRSRVLSAADSAFITTIAGGLRLNRRARALHKSIMDRAAAKAEE